MSGHRHAAVTLYGLSEHDQGLVLSELGAADQRMLRAGLAELAELGFERGELDALRAAMPAAPHAAPAPPDPVAGAGAARMLELLAGEPASLVAQLLRSGPWPWSADFIDLLAPPRRALVRRALDAGGAAAPARAAFLVEAVGAALGQPSALAPAAAPGRLGLLLKAVRWNR